MLDVADPAAALQYEAVEETLGSLFEEVRELEEREARSGDGDGRAVEWREPERIVLLNKVDALKDNREVLVWQSRAPGAIAISGRDPAHPGHEALRQRIRDAAKGEVQELRITVPLADSRTIHTIENRAKVLERVYEDGRVTLHVQIGRMQLDQLRSAGARMTVSGAETR